MCIYTNYKHICWLFQKHYILCLLWLFLVNTTIYSMCIVYKYMRAYLCIITIAYACILCYTIYRQREREQKTDKQPQERFTWLSFLNLSQNNCTTVLYNCQAPRVDVLQSNIRNRTEANEERWLKQQRRQNSAVISQHPCKVLATWKLNRYWVNRESRAKISTSILLKLYKAFCLVWKYGLQ